MDSWYSLHFVELVRRGDLSEVINDAELASMAVRFLRSIDLSEGTSDAEFASMAVQFLRSVCERFVEADGEFVNKPLKRWPDARSRYPTRYPKALGSI